MLTSVRTRRKRKRREEEDGRSEPAPAADAISDPLREPESDPLRVTELRDELVEEAARYEEKEEERRAHQAELRARRQEVVERLDAESSLDDEVLTPQALKESPLSVDTVPDLMELDDLGALMTTLGQTDALDDDDPIVEAVIEDDLEEAVESSNTGFANVFVDTDKMVENEQRSQSRPFHNADTQMQVTPMSWVPNRIKMPVGRMAMDEPLVDRGLNHMVKQDVSTGDEDHDIGVRTRARYTPALPTADAVTAGMGATEQGGALQGIAAQVQTYHEVMQSTPDMGKTFLLGQIRMLDQWVSAEQPRLDLSEGQTPLDWMQSTLLPAIMADMKVHQNYFDVQQDMLFYRQWRSEALRVVRKAAEKLEEQQRLREEKQAHDEKEDRLGAIPEGELLQWSMDNPDDALELYEDPEFSTAYSDRLLEELFSDAGVQGYLAQVDAMAAAVTEQAEGEEAVVDDSAEAVQEALLDMDIGRLQVMLDFPELEQFTDQIQASILAIDGLAPALRGILLTMMTRYGTKSSALADLAHDNPTATVLTVTRGAEERPIPLAAVVPTVPTDVRGGYRPHLDPQPETEADEDDDGGADDDAAAGGDGAAGSSDPKPPAGG